MSERFFITGVTSFVGASLARRWSTAGHRVTGLLRDARENYRGIRAERLAVLERAGVDLRRADAADPAAMAKAVEEARPTVALHHAGWVDGYAGMDYDFDRGYAVNVAPLSTLVPALAKAGARGLLVTGSASEYADGPRPHREGESGLPSLPYGFSKWLETRRAAQLAARHGLKTRVARLFIPFGPWDTPAKVLPSALEALRAGKPMELSPCEQKRDFTYIDDVLDGYDRLRKDLAGEKIFDVFNLSAGRPMRLRDVLEALADALGADRRLLRFGAKPIRPGEPEVVCGANAKAKRLGWEPRPWAAGMKAYVAATRGNT